MELVQAYILRLEFFRQDVDGNKLAKGMYLARKASDREGV